MAHACTTFVTALRSKHYYVGIAQARTWNGVCPLSTYLGHAHVTYWYLTSTRELMGAAGKRMEERWGVLARIRKRGFLSERRFAEGLSVGEQAAAGPSGVSLPGIRGSQEEAVAT